MKPVLFVSHSSKDNEFAKAVVQLVEHDDDCKTVFDVHDLVPGNAWRPQLFQWMARCHAALILLTPEGAKSDWVLQEATVLRARKALEPGFRVFVVVAPDLKTALPDRWKLFEPLALDEIQGLRTLDAATISETVRTSMREMVAAGRPTLFDRLAGVLGDILRDLVDKPHTLAVISEHLAIEDAEWTAITGGNETVVDLVARRLCRGDLGSYGELRDFLGALQPVSARDLLQRLLSMLGSYWVVPAAAALFPAASDGAPPRLIAMRASRPDFLPLRHLERIYRPYGVVPENLSVCSGNETFADLRAQLVRALKQEVFGFDEADLSDDELLALLADDEIARAAHDAGAPAPGAAPQPGAAAPAPPRRFVLLSGLAVERLALDLAKAFPMLVFVVTVGDADALHNEWTHCRHVEPALERIDELRRSGEFNRAEKLIG